MSRKRRVFQCLIGILLVFVAALIEILGFNYSLLLQDSANRRSFQFELTNLDYVGFQEQEEGFLSITDEASLNVHFDAMYVNKLEFGYKASENFTADISVSTFDVYGNSIIETQKDISSRQLSRSVQNVRKDATDIKIRFPKGITITYIGIDNEFHFNWIRFIFFAVILLLIYFIILFRKLIGRKLEIGFLVLSLGTGLLMLLSFPMQNVAWDEQIHFKNAYSQNFTSAVVWTETAQQYSLVAEPQTMSLEERMDAIHYIDDNADYHTWTNLENKGKLINYKEFGYLTQSFFFKVGRVLGAPFSLCYVLGRLGNLLLYCIVMYFAIRHMKIGKQLMTVIGLVPTAIFVSCSYSYDPTVLAFLMLGFSYIITELLEPTKPLTFWPAAIFIGAVLFGCFPKEIYAPFLLLGLLLPKTKFLQNKQRWIFKIGIILLFTLMMSTFILPTLSNPSMTGDIRGGDTSNSRQMAIIFSHPLSYVKVWWNCFISTFGQYFIGSHAFFNFAYLGEESDFALQIVMVLLIFFAIFADSNLESKAKYLSLTKRDRLVLFGVLAVIIGMIWTALYLSFTPVGLTTINGVQPRYYLPILVPAFLLIRTDKIKNQISLVNSHSIILGTSLFLLAFTMYRWVLEVYAF